MKNYQAYFAYYIIVGLIMASIFCMALVDQEAGYLFYIVMLSIPVGISQLVTGLRLLTRFTNYPKWARQGILLYWGLSIGYFIILFIGNALLFVPQALVIFWLAIAPWGIAIYQIVLVYRLSQLRSAQLEKRAFFQLYK